MKTTRYALTFIDSNGGERLVSKNAEIVDIDKLPFYISEKNATKAQRSVVSDLKKHWLDKRKHWNDVALDPSCEEPEFWKEQCIKEYKDSLLMIENGLTISEVTISL